MSDATATSKSKATKKRKLSITTVVEDEEVPSDKLVDVDDEEEDNVTESNEDLVCHKLHTKITKASSKGTKGSKKDKAKKKEEGRSKWGDPISTWGLGSLVKRARVEKMFGKEEHMKVLKI